MKRMAYNTASRRHTFIAILGIIMLAFLVLISITGATQLADASNSGSNNYNDLNKVYEKDMQTQDKALQINPLDEYAWSLKGDDLAALHRYDEAMIAYDQAIKVNPRNPLLWEVKGAALDEYYNDHEGAIKTYDEGIKVNSLDKEVWYLWFLKGQVLDELGRYHEAIDAYNNAIVLNPNNSTSIGSTLVINAKEEDLKKLSKSNL